MFSRKKAKEHTADLSMLIIIHRLRTIFYYLPFPHLWKCVLRVHHCSEASKDTFFTMINHTKCVHHVALLFPPPGPRFLSLAQFSCSRKQTVRKNGVFLFNGNGTELHNSLGTAVLEGTKFIGLAPARSPGKG